jgi:hypothetical protein
MKTTKLSQVVTFCASVAFGCGAALAAASVAAVSHSAPSLRTTTTVAAPVEVVRLEPITVTVSKATFEAVRQKETALARAEAAKKVTRG